MIAVMGPFLPSPGKRLGRPGDRCVDADADDFWRRTHAIHHASSATLNDAASATSRSSTVRDLSRSFWGRLCYRAYRNPLIMFGLGPAYLFILQYRLPVGLFFNGWRNHGSVPWQPMLLLLPSTPS